MGKREVKVTEQDQINKSESPCEADKKRDEQQPNRVEQKKAREIEEHAEAKEKQALENIVPTLGFEP